MAATFLKHGSNLLIAAMALVLAVAMASGVIRFEPAAVAAGALLFFLTEYTTHRFLLHAPPATHPFVRRMQHRLHYDHHLAPERLDLLFLPPWFLLPVLAVFVGAYFSVAHSAAVVAALVLGNLLGLLYYEWVHYVAHIPFRPRTAVGRYVKKYHLWHHFKNERLWFGVTNPSMDHVWRTYARVDEADRSESTRILYR